MKPILILERIADLGEHGGTLGVLRLGSTKTVVCKTIELTWNGNKISRSCLPLGDYEVRPYDSSRFKHCFAFSDFDTKPRTAIRFHAGNTAGLPDDNGEGGGDTSGCVLVGSHFGTLDGKPAVLNSRNTLEMLLRTYPAGFHLAIKHRD